MMKSELITKVNSFTEYTCETCGRTSRHVGEIERCETEHQCQHPNVYYQIEDTCDGVEVGKFCKTCSHDFPTAKLLQCFNDIAQRAVGQLYNSLLEGKKAD